MTPTVNCGLQPPPPRPDGSPPRLAPELLPTCVYSHWMLHAALSFTDGVQINVPYTRDRHERSPATTSSDSETEVESLPYGRDRSLLMPEATSGFNKRHPFLQNSSRDDSENEHPVNKLRSYLCQSAGTEESMVHTGPSDGEQMSNYI